MSSPHSPGSLLPTASYVPREDLPYTTITLSNKGTVLRYGVFIISAPTQPDSAFDTPSTGYFPIGPEADAATCRPQTHTTTSWPPRSRATSPRPPMTACSRRSRWSTRIMLAVISFRTSKPWLPTRCYKRWSIHLPATDFYMMIDTDQGAQMLDDLPHSLLDVLKLVSTRHGKTHQHLDAFTTRECSPFVADTPSRSTRHRLRCPCFKWFHVGIHSSRPPDTLKRPSD